MEKVALLLRRNRAEEDQIIMWLWAFVTQQVAMHAFATNPKAQLGIQCGNTGRGSSIRFYRTLSVFEMKYKYHRIRQHCTTSHGSDYHSIASPPNTPQLAKI